MRYSLLSLLFICCLCLLVRPSKASAIDTLHQILNDNGSKEQKQQKIVRLCYDRFLRSSRYDHLDNAMVDSLAKYEVSGRPELGSLIKILACRRKFELPQADKLLSQSITMALQHGERFFLCQFYLNQAFVQTDLGNSLRAVYNYRLARKVAEELNNLDLLMSIDIGVSDIYVNIGLYPQALAYLDQAQTDYNQHQIAGTSTQKLIYLNKAETYFKLGHLDSLSHYTKLARSIKDGNVYTERVTTRLGYFALILEKKYQLALPIIKGLLNTGNSYYKDVDRWYLAKSYYQVGQLDSAFFLATRLAQERNLGFQQIRLEAYHLLASIAKERNQPEKSMQYLQLALKESEDYTLRLSKFGDLASDLRLDRMESAYTARNLIYEKERIILVMAVAVAVLGIIASFVFYRNIIQKSRFQRLLHQSRSEELAFINSHHVRKPLANIIGICNLIDGHQPDATELRQYLEYVQREAKEMDDGLKDVEKRLQSEM